jgi:hypothetical protein
LSSPFTNKSGTLPPAGLFVVSPPGLPLGGSPEARILRRQEYVRNLLDTLREVPGIEGAAGATTYPLRQFGVAAGLSLPNVADWAPTTVRMNQVTTDYFRVLRLRFLEGREPAESRGAGEAVVNQTLARALAVHGPVVGQQIVLAGFRARVVGVVEDCVNERPDAVREPEVYVSVWSPSLVVVRVDGSPTARARLQSVADRVAYPEAGGTVRSVEEERRRANTGYRARMLLLAVLAGVGMLLAVLGVAGALYDEIRQQTRDIAIRAALGAEAADIGWQVLRRPVLCAVCAAVGGSAVGAPLGHAARSLLFDVSGFDVVTAVAVSGVLTAVALAAGYPALRQAVAVDPATALRHE